MSVTRRPPRNSILLTAFAGAWIGHFLEYVRVAGWHAGIRDMASSAHSYFFPAGAALVALVVGASLVARRAWVLLGDRLHAAEIGLWRRPANFSKAPRTDRPSSPIGLLPLWVALTALQIGTWVVQENLEALGSGEHAPWLGVMGGLHWMAPLIQAEVALILGVVYWVIQRRFGTRRSRLALVERLVARKWTARYGLLPAASRAAGVPSTPLDRWGAQRWQRPPPVALVL